MRGKELLKYVIEGILNGKLEHDQGNWHCDTAHCVAGWYEVYRAQEYGWVYNPETDFFHRDKKSETRPMAAKKSYAEWIASETGYDEDDLDELFEAWNTHENIKEIWEKMNA